MRLPSLNYSRRLSLALVLVVSQALCNVFAASLVVGLSPDYEPLVFKRDGQLVGIEVDNAREMAAAMDMELRFVELPFVELLPALQAGKIDVVMSGMSITEQREVEAAFVEPFMQIGQMAIIRAADIVRFGYPRAIYKAGTRVGVEPGTTGAQFVAEAMPEAQVLDFNRPEEAFVALRSSIIDVYVHDAPTSWSIANSDNNDDLFSLYRRLTEESLGWAVRKDDEELLRKMNQARAVLEQSGRLRAIQDFWIPVKVEVN